MAAHIPNDNLTMPASWRGMAPVLIAVGARQVLGLVVLLGVGAVPDLDAAPVDLELELGQFVGQESNERVDHQLEERVRGPHGGSVCRGHDVRRRSRAVRAVG
mgnify:CR=1 FL=1